MTPQEIIAEQAVWRAKRLTPEQNRKLLEPSNVTSMKDFLRLTEDLGVMRSGEKPHIRFPNYPTATTGQVCRAIVAVAAYCKRISL